MDESGYSCITKAQRHYDYEKNGISLELHYHYSDVNWDIEQHIIDGISRSVECEFYGQRFPTLPLEINGLVLIDHIRSHLYGGLGLRQIIDWMMFVNAFGDDKMWMDCLAPLVREAGLETLATTVTKMCKLWLGLPDDITWCDEADEETACRLLEMIFLSGNFGRKEHNQDSPMKGIIMESSKYGVFHYLQITGEYTWEAYHKHPFLKPFAWLYQSCRLAKRGTIAIFRGERSKLEATDAIKRRSFLEKLDIVYSPSNKEKEHNTMNH